jgi:hypothetical protein
MRINVTYQMIEDVRSHITRDAFCEKHKVSRRIFEKAKRELLDSYDSLNEISEVKQQCPGSRLQFGLLNTTLTMPTLTASKETQPHLSKSSL